MGHLITAAGAAGLIKVLEAIRHQRRPQTLHCDAPNAALNGGPFRLLTEAEDWPSDGPRIAAVSAFGFGGNNAHLIVSEEDPSIAAPAGASRSASAPSSVPLAIVAAGTLVGAATNRQEFTQTLLRGDSLLRPGPSGLPEARMADIPVGLRGLRFPPKDLEQALPQQVALLAAAREAIAQCGPLDSIRTGVFVGMEPDPAVCRYGLRWRQHSGSEKEGHRLRATPNGWPEPKTKSSRY